MESVIVELNIEILDIGDRSWSNQIRVDGMSALISEIVNCDFAS